MPYRSRVEKSEFMKAQHKNLKFLFYKYILRPRQERGAIHYEEDTIEKEKIPFSQTIPTYLAYLFLLVVVTTPIYMSVFGDIVDIPLFGSNLIGTGGSAKETITIGGQ